MVKHNVNSSFQKVSSEGGPLQVLLCTTVSVSHELLKHSHCMALDSFRSQQQQRKTKKDQSRHGNKPNKTVILIVIVKS